MPELGPENITTQQRFNRVQEDLDLIYARMKETADELQAARSRVAELESRLRISTQALDDWTSTYAPEFCDEGRVKEAGDRIMDGGGTLAYIAGIVHPNHQMLKR